MDFIKKAMLRARVRICCIPSSSWHAWPGLAPCTPFQYWPLATGMPQMVKYLFNSSKVLVRPPRLAAATAAPTFMVLSNLEL